MIKHLLVLNATQMKFALPGTRKDLQQEGQTMEQWHKSTSSTAVLLKPLLTYGTDLRLPLPRKKWHQNKPRSKGFDHRRIVWRKMKEMNF